MSAKSPVEKDVPYSTDYDKAASLYRLTLYDLNMLPHIFCRGIRMLSTANAPKCSEICFIASSNPSVWCIMHSGNARQTWNEPVAERGRRLYFCARQKAHIYVPYSEFQIEVENHNLSGLLYGVSCGTKCFLFTKSLSRVRLRVRRANDSGAPQFPFFDAQNRILEIQGLVSGVILGSPSLTAGQSLFLKFFLTTKMQIQRRDRCSLVVPGNSSYCDKVNFLTEV
jgi:hypothetical protein